MKYLYQNWSTAIFMGFYESPLYNSDTEYYLNEMLQDEEHKSTYEIDFDAYTKAVSEFATELLKDYCINSDNIIKSMKFKNLYSPNYYNFDTDRLNSEIDLNLTKLKQFIKANKSDFNLYLHENFTSYDGFMSFISNNYNDFMIQYLDDKNRCINVMLEYYILTCIYSDNWKGIHKQFLNGEQFDTPYHTELFENNNEYQWNYAIKVSDAA